MSWNLPKLLPKIKPNPPNLLVWIGFLLLKLAIATAAIYYLKSNDLLSFKNELYLIYGAVMLGFLFIYGFRIYCYETKLSYVTNYNKRIDQVRRAWRNWCQKGVRLSYLHRVTPFSPIELEQLENNELVIDAQDIFSINTGNDSSTESMLEERKVSLKNNIESLLKPFNRIEFDFLKHSAANLFFVVNKSDDELFRSNTNLEQLSAPILSVLEGLEALNFQILKKQSIASEQFHLWISKFIDSQSSQQTLVFFLDNNTNFTQTYSWWYIEPSGTRTYFLEQISNPVILMRPLEIPRSKISSGLTQLDKFQSKPTLFTEAWVNGATVDEHLIGQISISGQALGYGFSNKAIYNTSKVYGKTNLNSIGAVVSLMSERNNKASLVINVSQDNVAFLPIIPIKKRNS